MAEQLEFLAGLINPHDGPVHPNDADTLALEYDFEFGWTCGFKKGKQWVVCVASGNSAENAVQNCFDQWQKSVAQNA